MSEKNSNRYNRRQGHTQNLRKMGKTTRTKSTWSCQICKEDVNISLSFCFNCYQALHYYFYINMHLFVENDHSFRDIYFRNPYLPAPAAAKDREQSSLDLSSEEGEVQQLDIHWVENIFVGE